jgi:hypothetical protein
MNNEALRLADELETLGFDFQTPRLAAAVLRRLHEVNQELVEALKVCINNPYREGTASYNNVIKMAEAELAKAGESNA